MSVHRKKSMSDFEFYQTTYLGGRISQKIGSYKDFSMKETDEQFAKWFIEHAPELMSISPDEALCQILDVHSRLEYLKGMTEVSHMSMKLGDTAKRTDARKLGELLKRARDGIKV